MLVLTRRPGRGDESVITIGKDIADFYIEIEVLEVHGDQVRIGIKAPRTIPVHRTEIWEAILNELRKDGHISP